MIHEGAHTIDVTAALAALRTQGFARLGRVLSDEGVTRLRERADDLMLGRVRVEGMFFQHDSPTGDYEDLEFGKGWVGPSPAYRKVEKLELDEVMRAWIGNEVFGRVARAWIGPEVTLYRAMLMNKVGAAGGGGTELPWHQDGGLFWGVDRAPTLQVWTALDDATATTGAMRFVPGSHRAGLVRASGGNVPRELVEREEGRAELVEARAGEVILVHNHVWHRSGRNGGAGPRRALSFCYMDAATRCTRKRHAPREFVRVFSDHV